MTWENGYVRLSCGHEIGTAAWATTFVGDDVRCPQCKATRQVTRMSRIYEARGSRDFQLGLVGGDADGRPGPGEPEAEGP
jgi:hypothetical protein